MKLYLKKSSNVNQMVGQTSSREAGRSTSKEKGVRRWCGVAHVLESETVGEI